jgi:hypothetical protein
MAYGLPVEGDDGPFAGERATPVATAGPDDRAGEVLDRLRREGADRAVVTVADGVVLGLVERRALEAAPTESPVAAVMSLSPTSVRPSVEYAGLVEQGDEHVLVTTPDGRLVGVVEPERSEEPHAGRDLERDLLGTIAAVEEHFGGRDVSEDDIRSFLRDRLVEEGRTAEEADRFLAALGDEQRG